MVADEEVEVGDEVVMGLYVVWYAPYDGGSW